MSTGPIFNSGYSVRNNYPQQTDPFVSLGDLPPGLSLYLRKSETMLERIRADFTQSQSDPGSSKKLYKAAIRLSEFCVDTDGWGFDAIYRVAFGMQAVLLNTLHREHDDNFWCILNRGLALLRALLKECENDYRQRIAVDDMLDDFSRAGSC